MATATLKRVREFGPESAGILMSAREFDRADFDENWVYELINGVLVVAPIPLESEVDPNEQLGHWLRTYKETHPQGSALDATLPERYIRVGQNRRRADRVIWAGLGRKPRRNETPTIAAEFVSAGKRDRERDFETKRDEYMRVRIQEYWVFDRFHRTLTVFTRQGGRTRKRVFREDQVYRTDLLPGFELPLARLFELADYWSEEDEDE